MATWSEYLTAAGVLGVIGVIIYAGLTREDRQMKPGSPEHTAYINSQIADCEEWSLADDLRKSREELPIMPTAAERHALCRMVVIELGQIFPSPPARRKNSD